MYKEPTLATSQFTTKAPRPFLMPFTAEDAFQDSAGRKVAKSKDMFLKAQAAMTVAGYKTPDCMCILG